MSKAPTTDKPITDEQIINRGSVASDGPVIPAIPSPRGDREELRSDRGAVAIIATDHDGFSAPSSFAPAPKKLVSVPFFSLKFDPVSPKPLSFVCKILTAIERGKAPSERMKAKRGKAEADREPAMICMIESVSGTVAQIACGEVFCEDMLTAYPNDGYVGCWFHITKYPPAPGKDYSLYRITEIDPPMIKAAAE